MKKKQQSHAELVSASFKRFRNKFGMTFIMIFISLFFISCTTEVTLTVRADDSVDIRFEGSAGEAFIKMMNSAAGTEDSFLIDEDSVSYELAKAGFSSVKVSQNNGRAVQISMSDKKQSSYIFTSGIVITEKGKLKTSISRKSLEDFYNSADEQTRMTLDLFLAPVFNNETMSEEEYLEMLASFYGNATAKEVSESLVKINLISNDGSKQTLTYPLTQVFCGLF